MPITRPALIHKLDSCGTEPACHAAHLTQPCPSACGQQSDSLKEEQGPAAAQPMPPPRVPSSAATKRRQPLTGGQQDDDHKEEKGAAAGEDIEGNVPALGIARHRDCVVHEGLSHREAGKGGHTAAGVRVAWRPERGRHGRETCASAQAWRVAGLASMAAEWQPQGVARRGGTCMARCVPLSMRQGMGSIPVKRAMIT